MTDWGDINTKCQYAILSSFSLLIGFYIHILNNAPPLPPPLSCFLYPSKFCGDGKNISGMLDTPAVTIMTEQYTSLLFGLLFSLSFGLLFSLSSRFKIQPHWGKWLG